MCRQSARLFGANIGAMLTDSQRGVGPAIDVEERWSLLSNFRHTTLQPGSQPEKFGIKCLHMPASLRRHQGERGVYSTSFEVGSGMRSAFAGS